MLKVTDNGTAELIDTDALEAFKDDTTELPQQEQDTELDGTEETVEEVVTAPKKGSKVAKSEKTPVASKGKGKVGLKAEQEITYYNIPLEKLFFRLTEDFENEELLGDKIIEIRAGKPIQLVRLTDLDPELVLGASLDEIDNVTEENDRNCHNKLKLFNKRRIYGNLSQLKELKDSYLKRGFRRDCPIMIYVLWDRKADGSKESYFVIEEGHRRAAMAAYLKQQGILDLEKIPSTNSGDGKDDEQRLATQLTQSQAQQKTFTMLETAETVQEIFSISPALNNKVKSLADKYGLNYTYLINCQKLGSADPKVKALIYDGKIAESTALAIMSEHPANYVELILKQAANSTSDPNKPGKKITKGQINRNAALDPQERDKCVTKLFEQQYDELPDFLVRQMSNIIDNWKAKLSMTQQLLDALEVIAESPQPPIESRHVIKESLSKSPNIFRLLDKRLFDPNRDIQELLEEVRRELSELKKS